MMMQTLVLVLCLISYLLEHVNPSPVVYGSLHVHEKFELNSPSLVQSAFISHGLDAQGSGTKS